MTTSTRSAAMREEARVQPFSILTCLFVGALVLVAETWIDFFFYPFGGHGLHTARATIVTIATLLHRFGVGRIFAWGVFWWIPITALGFFVGYKTGVHGLLYMSCGVLIYLVVIHNFRGFSTARQVFEYADDMSRFPISGSPSPLEWDVLYVIIAVVSSTFGWVYRFSKEKLRRQAKEVSSIGSVATLYSGWLCALIGMVTTLVITFIIQPEDIYVNMPRMTYGYAMLTYGIVVILLIKYSTPLSNRFGVDVV